MENPHPRGAANNVSIFHLSWIKKFPGKNDTTLASWLENKDKKIALIVLGGAALLVLACLAGHFNISNLAFEEEEKQFRFYNHFWSCHKKQDVIDYESHILYIEYRRRWLAIKFQRSREFVTCRYLLLLWMLPSKVLHKVAACSNTNFGGQKELQIPETKVQLFLSVPALYFNIMQMTWARPKKNIWGRGYVLPVKTVARVAQSSVSSFHLPWDVSVAFTV